MPPPSGRAEDLRTLFSRLKGQPNLARFLIANMIYTDGMVGLFSLGGIYAAGTFGWGSVQIGTFGITHPRHRHLRRAARRLAR